MKFAQLTPGRGFSPFHSMFYYGQRLVTSLALRRLCVGVISAGVRLRHGSASASTLTSSNAKKYWAIWSTRR